MAYEPTTEELADAPKITIGGRQFPIVKQAPRQTRVILPLAFKLQPLIGTPNVFTPETLDDMGTVIFTALHRGNPSITREEFDDLALGLDDMMMAFAVVLQQCGLGIDLTAGAPGAAPLAPAASPPPQNQP